MNTDEPLYRRDPEAWREHLAEGNATQPRKRSGADVLLRDDADRLLLVDPRYKPDWDLPGGMGEANEPPTSTAKRELKEELGLEVTLGRLLCVDWVPPHGPWDDSLMFVFDGGKLDDLGIAGLAPNDGEIRAFDFCTELEAKRRLRPYVWRRLSGALQALRKEGALYLQDGYPFAS
jgi:ADP-ribose pyrophosphatase YjhB (NUDIX family)